VFLPCDVSTDESFKKNEFDFFFSEKTEESVLAIMPLKKDGVTLSELYYILVL